MKNYHWIEIYKSLIGERKKRIEPPDIMEEYLGIFENDPIEDYKIKEKRNFSRTRNGLAWFLVCVFSLLIFAYFAFSIMNPNISPILDKVFKGICIVLMPLLFIAIRTYHKGK